MTPERYQTLLRWLEARPALKKLVIALNRWLPAVPFACYPLLLVLLNVRWFRLLSANRAAALDFMQLIARAVFVPAFVFLGGTLLRARLNFPRPYEQPGFTPLVAQGDPRQVLPLPPRPERCRAGRCVVLLLPRRRGLHGGGGPAHLRPAGACRGALCPGCGRRCSARLCPWGRRNVPTVTPKCPLRRKIQKNLKFCLTEAYAYGIILLAACAKRTLPPDKYPMG